MSFAPQDCRGAMQSVHVYKVRLKKKREKQAKVLNRDKQGNPERICVCARFHALLSQHLHQCRSLCELNQELCRVMAGLESSVSQHAASFTSCACPVCAGTPVSPLFRLAQSYIQFLVQGENELVLGELVQVALGWFSSASYVCHLNTWPSLYEASWPSSPFCVACRQQLGTEPPLKLFLAEIFDLPLYITAIWQRYFSYLVL